MGPRDSIVLGTFTLTSSFTASPEPASSPLHPHTHCFPPAMADTLSDDDLHNLSPPASDDDGSGTPAARNTVEDNDNGPGIDDADDDDDDDLFGDGGDGGDGDDGDAQEEPAA